MDFVLDLDPQILWSYLGVLALITLNAGLGILRALITGEFEADLVPRYLKVHILPDGGALLLVALTALVAPHAQALYWGGVAAATVKYANKIREKLVAKGLADEE